MIERNAHLDLIFHSLADTTRRDILGRLAMHELSVGEIASRYEISLAATSKHLFVLEKAGLVTKRREGKQQIAALAPDALTDASALIDRYRQIWEHRLDRLETYLETQE